MTPNHATPVPAPDGLDRLLTDFFTRELPRPWPGPPAAAVPADRRRSDAGPRSRYALAASVAALLGLGVYLSSAVPGGRPTPGAGQPGLLKEADAQGDKLLKHANPRPVNDPPMGIPNMP
jgi:hypothetical protein